MKIVHLSSSDIGGGAALAAHRLHSGLRRKGADSWMIVGRKFSGDPHVVRPVSRWEMEMCERLDRQPRRLLKTQNQSYISSGWAGSSAWKDANHRQADLTHLHWINKGFLRVEALPKLRGPLVWSLHDMWAFAGGEHYFGDCRRYRDGYLKNNRPAFESGFDLNRWIWERKRRAWASIPSLTLFCVSDWLAQRARESVLFRDRPVETVYNALDPAVFAPAEKLAARKILNLPAGRTLVLFGAIDATEDKRKGFDLMAGALRELRGSTENMDLVVFGNSPRPNSEADPDLGFKIHYLGKIDDNARLALVYSACDVMIVPSREESFGQTALEALACGTPVVAFRVGGLPEIVEHEVSGFLAEPFDVRELAGGIAWVLAGMKTGDWARLSAAGRACVERKFTLEIQSARCESLYAGVLAGTTAAGKIRETVERR
jgi:glycosyltransferase involved in cell wall biosynthesis